MCRLSSTRADRHRRLYRYGRYGTNAPSVAMQANLSISDVFTAVAVCWPGRLIGGVKRIGAVAGRSYRHGDNVIITLIVILH